MDIENKGFEVSLHKNPSIKMTVIPGHFTTSRAHITHYLDVSALKSNALVARDVARELALPYLSSHIIETIVCMEGTEVIGAYMAEELLQTGSTALNSNGEIFVVTPISNNLGHLSFKKSMIKQIANKNTILLAATISSGRTLDGALDCLAYYGVRIVGISSIFMVPNEKFDLVTHTMFTSYDIPGYTVYSARNCEMCKAGIKLDALISSEGYTDIIT